MTHPESRILSEYLDGDLEPRDAIALEGHLEECPSCAALLEDLESLRNRARSLPDPVPPRDLWPGISAAIRRLGVPDPRVIRLHPRGPLPDTADRRPGIRLSYLQAAAAGLVLALFSGGVGAALHWGPGTPETVAAADEATPWLEMVKATSPELGETAGEVARLEDLLARYRDRLDPGTARILEKNLGVIDRAIRESVRALEADPGNSFLESHLARSLEAKGAYLREAAAFVVPSS